MSSAEVQQVDDWVWSVTAGVFPSNAYICLADIPGGCILVDPGLDGESIDKALTERGLEPRKIFCTHGHFDHAGSAAFFQKKYGAEVFLHAADVRTLKASNFLLMAFKIPAWIDIPNVNVIEDENFTCDVGGVPLTYHGSPGHTPGSCLIKFGNRFFTGDTIYSHGVGLSRLPGEDAEMLKRSILSLWPMFVGDTRIHPGHGKSSTASAVRAGNRQLLQFLGLVETGDEVL